MEEKLVSSVQSGTGIKEAAVSRDTAPAKTVKKKRPDFDKVTWKEDAKRNWPLYLIALIPVVFFGIFHYAPMVGLLMAFEDYAPAIGLFKSKWVGLANFKSLFSGTEFLLAFRNTTMIALLNLTLGFAAPVLLGLLVSQLHSKRFSRLVQTVTYIPYFVSSVVVCTIAQIFLSDTGAVVKFLENFGYTGGNLLAQNSSIFWFIICLIGIWQMAGYSSIIYITSIAGINMDLYDAASIDGSNRWQMMKNVTLPGILPLIIMMFTMRIGMIFRQGYDMVQLLYMPTTYEHSDVLFTFIYRKGLGGRAYGLSTAAGLFQSLLSTVLLVSGNWLSRKLTRQSIF